MISVIVCHHKGELIYPALASIRRSEGVDFEIIVVTSVEGTEFKDADRTVFCKGGPAKKRNFGCRFANGSYLAFMDDDVEVDRDCLKEMLGVLKADSCGMVFGKTLNMERRHIFDEAGGFLTWNGFIYARAESGTVEDTGQYDRVEPILAGKSASCMMKKSVFGEVGYFDPSYEILGEETDLAWRVWLWGYTVLWAPRSRAWHAFNTKFKPRDFYTNDRVFVNGCRNYLWMLYTNLGTANLWRLPIHMMCWVVAGLGMIVKGKREAGICIFRGIAQFFGGLDLQNSKRQGVQRKRRVDDKTLFRSIYRNPPLSYFTSRLAHYWRSGLHG